jgi:hypothetical protein
MGERRDVYRIFVGETEGKNHLENLGVDGRAVLNLKEVGWRRVDWIDFVQDSDRWRAFVNAVMNVRVL